MSVNLENRLAYIRASRRGVDFKTLHEQEKERKKEQIVAAGNQLGATLAQRQEHASQKMDELIQITKQPFLEPEEHHVAALKARLEGLKAVQNLSKIRNEIAQEEWMQKNPERKELLNRLAELNKAMKSVPK